MAGGDLAQEEPKPLLRVRNATREQAVALLDTQEAPASGFGGVELSHLCCELDEELADKIFGCCSTLSGGSLLRLAHSDLGSGTNCEQRLFELKGERQAREAEKAFHVKLKADSSKEKDFAVSAGKRRKAEAGIKEAEEKLEEIDREAAELEEQKATTQWFKLFTRLEATSCSSLGCLDLSDCGLHGTGLEVLSNALLEHEQRAEGLRVTSIVLDGNDLGDNGMGPLTSLLRLSAHVEVLRLRNVGITDVGVSKVISGLVGNKTLRLLDLRNNGLASPEITRPAVGGVMRFNKTVEILLE